MKSRREFLKFLAASPLLARLPQNEAVKSALIASPNDALNVFEFEPVMRDKVPPAHFGYMSTGVDDDATIRANRDGFTKFQIRPRRLVDVSKIDTSVELFGRTWKSPIFLSPVGGQRAFHAEGELAVARAAKAKQHLQILSTVTSNSVEDVNTARGEPVWYQLYPTPEWKTTEGLVKRAQAAGCPALVFTVDLLAGRNTETDKRLARIDTRNCVSCHQPQRIRPMFQGLVSVYPTMNAPNLTWDSIKRLRDLTKMKLLLKGIVTREDAELCVENGVDGIIVSNHGGRSVETGASTIEVLTEVLDAVQGRVPVLIDSGFRRGTDIFKALALGAKAVGVGRPYIWGLGAFGQPGVEKVLDILTREFDLIMRQSGVTSLAKLNRNYIQRV